MSRKWVGIVVALVIFAGAAMAWAENPTNLTVIRKSDNTLWKRTCDGTSSCSDWAKIGGKFAVQPTLTWDQSIQKYILIGIGNNKVSIFRSTFEADGTWNNDWTDITGTSGGSPSPVAVSGGALRPQTITVTCPEQSLQAAVDAAQTGATINVTGTCNENVIIHQEKARLTIDGGNEATLSGDSSSYTLTIRGRGITIQNFSSITGGSIGILVQHGGSAAIIHNDINNVGGGGIVVTGLAGAIIKLNNIHDNLGDGIAINDNSLARIGFDSTAESSASPNTIQNNGGVGILVGRASTARIAGNTIANNTAHGILVYRLSQADIAGNTINGNGKNGIEVGNNSGVQLGEDNPTKFFQQPNITTLGSENGQYGINCYLGGCVNGHLGSENQINGTLGQTNITGTCPQNLVTP